MILQVLGSYEHSTTALSGSKRSFGLRYIKTNLPKCQRGNLFQKRIAQLSIVMMSVGCVYVSFVLIQRYAKYPS